VAALRALPFAFFLDGIIHCKGYVVMISNGEATK